MQNQDALDVLLRDTLLREVSDSAPVLLGLEERVVARLGDRPPRRGARGWLRQLVAPTRAARFAQGGLLTTTAAVFLALGVVLSGGLADKNQTPQLTLSPAMTARGDQEVLFVLPALNASNVAVVGDFNAWEEMPLSDEDNDGIWTASLPLEPGRYEYAFIIDGKWWGQDPLADEYVRSFGQYSSVRYIGGGG